MRADPVIPAVGSVWQHKTTGKLATVTAHFTDERGLRRVDVRYNASGNRRTRLDIERTYFLRMYRHDHREICPACGRPR